MKTLCKAVSLLFLTGVLHAVQSPILTYQTAVSSITTFIAHVSTSTSGAGPGATQMDNPQLSGRVSLEIQNIDTSANLWCLPVSTAPTVAQGARKIAPGNSWVISTSDAYVNTTRTSGTSSTAVKFWCISDGVAFSSAAVTQAY